ncbi:hypothetical protein B0H16DRAFT_939115 [Mycena metata]|uniref:Uncharacterized protein n=1 Tax=Mycena metata TaxID=1033252 RepID=A0AAD7DHP6_9AGAR|nr:hypothetical protein B0H16DRAFT_939115 [Mycena metata]
MLSKSAIVSLALVAAASPALSAPVPAAERRAFLPEGELGSLIKSLGKGLLSGGAVAGLLGILGHGSSSTTAAPAPASTPAARDLEARGIASLLDGLIGAGEDSLESVLKKAVLGGLASGAAVAGVNSVAGQTNKRLAASIIEDGAEAAEDGLKHILGNGAANGIGSAVGGLGIGAIIHKLFGSSSSTPAASSKRALADLSDAEFDTLLEWINEKNTSGVVATRALGSLGKGIAGLVAGLAATQGAESAIDELEKIFKREPSLNELD